MTDAPRLTPGGSMKQQSEANYGVLMLAGFVIGMALAVAWLAAGCAV